MCLCLIDTKWPIARQEWLGGTSGKREELGLDLGAQKRRQRDIEEVDIQHRGEVTEPRDRRQPNRNKKPKLRPAFHN